MEKLKLLLLALFFGFSINTWAQKTDVTGVVLDDKGIPLPAANVLEKGTSNTVTTDFDGKFRISVSNKNATLVFSFIGFEDQPVKLDGTKTNLSIKLQSGTTNLEQVVVVGYGKGSRKNLTTAVTSIKADELNRGAISDVGQLLQGKVSGLNISSSGDPTKTASVVLRGASTLNSSQGPFYVIDGVPGVDISIISPDDIATIDVLKDAAATAIYGNRAANGVIMVTTKRGSKDRTQIAYNGYYGFEEVSNELNMMNADQLRAFTTKNNLNFTPENDKGANTDWQKEILRSRRAVSSSHNISMSGGGEHGNYTASITSIQKEGVLLKSDFSRVIARLSVDQYAFDDKLKIGLNVTNSTSNYTNVPQRNTVLLQAVSHLPVSPVRNPDGSFFENFVSTGYFNPVALIEHGTDETKTNNLVGNITAELKLPWGFTYNLNVAHQRLSTSHGEFYDSYYSRYNSANFYNNPDPPQTKTLINFGVNGSALRNSYDNTNNIVESFLNWDKTLGGHKIKAVLGYSWQENTYGDGFQATATNFPVDNVGYNNLALSNYTSVNGYVVNFGDSKAYQKTRLIGEFVRLNYGYKDKYLLQGTLRRDGGSMFGANNRWGFFPSVGGAWRVDKENFMKNQNFFTDLKFRGSYGVTGNSSGFNAYTAQFISGSVGTFYYNGQQIGAYGPNQAANPDLKWEKTATANVGVDFSILKGKITGSVDVYDKKTTDMIFNYAVNPVLVPVGTIVANGGTMSNKGIEVSLGATPVKTANFSWSTNLNLASNKNRIVKLTNPLFIGGDSIRRVQPDGGGQTGSTLQIFKEGKPLGQFFTLKYAGKDANGVSQYYDKNGNLTTTPLNGVDYHYVGDAQPKLLLGWGNTFTYKKFDLSVFFRGVFGNKIFNATRADLFRPSTAMTTNILVDAQDESPNDLNSYKYSSRFIEDGSYLRLDNMTLGYNFGKVGKFIQSVRVYETINNLFVITKYSGIDPEVEQGGTAPGVDSNNFYPKTRTFMFGLNVIF
ncbi:SusC/RagA family TonB-linked outer membrane protein [Flavobacterium johnsoniae]|uniref:SusC-like TonB-dependent receptor n=1 Tax=Flavobacterium johnsoniae (strain ATCC 17061 / DSM 2064 / JCM 8514 / BCRC 14874 / CCUG 350202 / NBRC 14942 / NCIMB 11054 / UW101) TaxID=376686 RepID=A5FF77_FLAJ1|nr:TonB-dependent receptor [Flavobacterium johnsoniae]ABQ06144.1 SusC-like TonB-dependent receptor [Flavobacterium johnsoniae UW101]OXE98380.1 SusC/RagA family TonB-linked outer membrane protein [Flavobacterium johnsoniae UW101]WQG81890.1 TonB-dependent receptor [Flavobacterium johnsoniae UW101]SHK67039.1 iron complex outermembrane recepter protein [Flavobacterium johnsoniae]